MLIECHGHHILHSLINQHPHWGPFFGQDEKGFFRTRVGDWTLYTVTKEQQAAAEAGTLAKVDIEELLEQKFGVAARLSGMDALGIDKMVISMGTPYLMYWTEPEFNIRYARLVNDEFASFCAQAPERLYFWGHLPLQDVAASVKEAHRAVRELGARGFSLGSSKIGGNDIDDPLFDPLWAALCDLDVPCFVHGSNQSAAWGPAASQEKFDVTSVLGMPYEESAIFWSLICGGVLDRFPTLKCYITHGGGMVPYQIGRLAGLNETLLSARNQRPMRDYLGNFWFDPLIHDITMRQAVVDVIGADRMLYGGSAGGGDGIREDLTIDLNIPDEDREKIRWKNAADLLRIAV